VKLLPLLGLVLGAALAVSAFALLLGVNALGGGTTSDNLKGVGLVAASFVVGMVSWRANKKQTEKWPD
jgi:hypothetical protein